MPQTAAYAILAGESVREGIALYHARIVTWFDLRQALREVAREVRAWGDELYKRRDFAAKNN